MAESTQHADDVADRPTWRTIAERDAWADKVTAEVAEGCCNNAQWRGRLCTYHQGFQFGVDETLERLGITQFDGGNRPNEAYSQVESPAPPSALQRRMSVR
jgi:hypothetical protein